MHICIMANRVTILQKVGISVVTVDTLHVPFTEKLLKLKDMMKTDSGKRMAECRHTIMVNYIDSFYKEWEGQA